MTCVREILTVDNVQQPSDYTLSTRVVAAMLGVNLDTVARWADADHLPCLKTPGGHRRFREADVLEFGKTLLPKANKGANAR